MDRLLDEATTRTQLGGIGKTTFYKLLSEGQLRTVKLGRRRFVLAASVQDYITRLQEQPPADVATRAS
ncbi:DNA-binding protein [Kineococcus terrestris]|uniref:DNA-binding protein n=1 Tax=Kineococcus terrestris TaxID=2044856 RepID=UPI0034DB5C25